MRTFKIREKNFINFKVKSSKYIGKLVNIKIHYKSFHFESFYENCIITSFKEGKKKYPNLYKNDMKDFYINFLSNDNTLKYAIVNSNDIDVFIDFI